VTEVTVTLKSEEALVLFELLHHWEDSHEFDTVLLPGEPTRSRHFPVASRASLVEPFEDNYRELVNRARQRPAKSGGA